VIATPWDYRAQERGRYDTVNQSKGRIVTNILAVNSSSSGEASVSKSLVNDIVQHLLKLDPKASVRYRDVGDAQVPHLTSATVAGIRAVANTDAELGAQSLSDELISEVRAADLLVVGAPMYNFSIPSTLRAWFDHLLRPRVTFEYSGSGPKGLLTGKRAFIVEARGGLYSKGPAKPIDFQEPYLRQLLGFVGITDITFIHAEKLGFGTAARDLALATARARIAEVVNLQPAAADNADADASIDYDLIMQANLSRVFSERDPSRRLEAIRELFDEDAQLHEPQGSVQGHEAISQAVSDLLAHLPSNFSFTPVRPAVGQHNVGRLQWRSGPPNGPVAVTGTDVAHFEGGLIRALYVFLDQPGA
jgi:FMN-dependent NADH-azoreductase